MRTPFLLALCAFFVSACSLMPDEAATQGLPAGPGDSVPFTRLSENERGFRQYSHLEEPMQAAVRDEQTWANLWAEIHAGQIPVPALPEVDFSSEMLVVAAMGPRSSGGYDIVIGGVYRDGDTLQVVTRSYSPGKTCVVTLAITSPVDIARTPRHDGPVTFHEEKQIRTCE